MTPKHIERIRKKITDIRKQLANEKRKYGYYDDSRGRRYLPTTLYIQLGDYQGGITYLRWFDRNFPDDSGFPEFLFERMILLFYAGKLQHARQMAFRTFCRNPYWIDWFLGKPVVRYDIPEWANIAGSEYVTHCIYHSSQTELADFTEWLTECVSDRDFAAKCNLWLDIQNRIKYETDDEKRRMLISEARHLQEES